MRRAFRQLPFFVFFLSVARRRFPAKFVLLLAIKLSPNYVFAAFSFLGIGHGSENGPVSEPVSCLGPTGTGTVKFHREQNVRTTARISRHIATCKEKSRHDLTKMRQRRSSALRFRAGTGLKGPERLRAGTVLEGPEPVPCSRHGSDTGS